MKNYSEIGYIPSKYEDVKRRYININKILILLEEMQSSVAINPNAASEEEIFRKNIDTGEAIDILNNVIEIMKKYAHKNGVKADPKGAIIKNIDKNLEKAPYGKRLQ